MLRISTIPVTKPESFRNKAVHLISELREATDAKICVKGQATFDHMVEEVVDVQIMAATLGNVYSTTINMGARMLGSEAWDNLVHETLCTAEYCLALSDEPVGVHKGNVQRWCKDVIRAAEVYLDSVNVTERARHMARQRVYEKNKARGYYD